MKRIVWVALCLALGACGAALRSQPLAVATETAPVRLRDPGSGLTATCGPYKLGLFSNTRVEQARCIDRYESRGYVRIEGEEDSSEASTGVREGL